MIKYIKVYDAVMPQMICNKLIKTFERNLSPNNRIDGLGDRYDEMIIAPEKRNSHVDIWKEFGTKILDIFNMGLLTYRTDCGLKTSKQLPDKMDIEEFSLKKYTPNDARFKKRLHSDSVGEGLNSRFVTSIIYLSTPEQRGETEFPAADLRVTPIQGSMIIFPSTWTYIYAENFCRGIIPKYTLTTHFRATSL
jgi:hypothetical protein|tara:strand:- start:285 stop:863 length:579 start_codon:yes stop_codon:yes gene_type:complete